MNDSLTMKLSTCVYEANPLSSTDAIEAAERGILDYIASCFAASDDKGVKNLLKLVESEGGIGKTPVIGQHKKVSLQHAALLNGFIGHALDYDDVHSDVRGHPSTVILPVLFSLHAVSPTITGARLIASYIIGVEVMARLGEGIGKKHYEKGWHNTGTLGVIAAAVAGSYLLQYEVKEIAKVIGFAATQASGLRMQFGTETKPLHAGLAAQSAIQAVQFVQHQIQGSEKGLDGPYGFFEVYGNGVTFASPFILSNWGDNWRISNPGLWFKRYPFCSAATHASDATYSLKEEYAINPRVIEAISVIYPSGGDAALIHQHPLNGEQGRFSVEYIIASILLNYELTIDHFQSETIGADIRELMKKIHREYDDTISPSLNSYPKGRFTIIDIRTYNQVSWSARVDAPKGSFVHPLTRSELEEKLENCVKDRGLANKIKHSISSIKEDGIAHLLALL